MDLTGITLEVVQNFIANLGFPIFMCLYFMYSQRKAENRHDKVLEELECIQAQQLETKLQTAQVIQKAAAAEPAAAAPAPAPEPEQAAPQQ